MNYKIPRSQLVVLVVLLFQLKIRLQLKMNLISSVTLQRETMLNFWLANCYNFQ